MYVVHMQGAWVFITSCPFRQVKYKFSEKTSLPEWHLYLPPNEKKIVLEVVCPQYTFRPMKVDVMVLVSARIKFCSRTKKVQHSSLTKFPRQKVPIWNCRLKKSTIFSIGCRAWPMWHASMPVNGWPIWRCLPSRSLIGPLCRPATSCLLRRPR